MGRVGVIHHNVHYRDGWVGCDTSVCLCVSVSVCLCVCVYVCLV